jgi:hypothetical protein
VDFDEIFSTVVKPATVRTILSLALSRQWPVHQLDVKNAFLHDTLSRQCIACSRPGLRTLLARASFVASRSRCMASSIVGMVQPLRCLPPVSQLHGEQVGHFTVRLPPRRRHGVPAALRRRHHPHYFLLGSPSAHHLSFAAGVLYEGSL